ncbi:phenylalanine--tRNA ligase subunit alpha, partial [Mycobacterium tuberculosis]|nr:phenylalanine--tRNA ligase subunit alpha [Mycobacterium tuberculosis]
LQAFADARTLDDLKAAKIDFMGDKAPLALANRAIGGLDKADKAAAGKIVGKSRGLVKKAHDERLAELEAERDAAVLIEESIDVTLPSDRRGLGARHPLSLIQEQAADYFIGLGWEVAEGPE